jgi:putative transposase
VEVIVGFIDENRGELGVEPMCRDLQVAPSTYYAAKARAPSARAIRDAVMIPILVAIWQANYSVYGAHKLWKAAQRVGHDIGRDQVARLMRQAGIRGVKRGRRIITTTRDDRAARSPDLVKRNFSAERPNALGVTDLTYVPTWSGVAYVCFIVDAFSRMIVGWRVASHMRTDMVLDALEMARWSRGTMLEGLIAHSDAGSQFTSIRYGERLTEFGAVPSIGSIGDSFDNALAEATNSLYKTELIRGPGRVRGRTSTMSNWPRSAGSTGTTRRGCTATSKTCHHQSSRRPTLPNRPTRLWLESNKPSLHQTQCGSVCIWGWKTSARFLPAALAW